METSCRVIDELKVARAMGKLYFVKLSLFGKGKPSLWDKKGNLIVQGSSYERRGGGLFLFKQRNVKLSNSLFLFNGYTKDGGGLYI